MVTILERFIYKYILIIIDKMVEQKQTDYGMTADSKWNRLTETEEYKANYKGSPRFLGYGKWLKDAIISLIPGSSIVNVGRIPLAIEDRNNTARKVYDKKNPSVPTKTDYNTLISEGLLTVFGGYSLINLLEAPIIAEGIKLLDGTASDVDVAGLILLLGAKTVVNSGLRYAREYCQGHTNTMKSMESNLEREVSLPFSI